MCFLLELPTELLVAIFNYLIPDMKSASRFARVSNTQNYAGLFRLTLTGIAKLLHYVAYAKPDAAKSMLEANPRLLLERDTVLAPSGLTIRRVTAFECALGAGNPDMAMMIAAFFCQLQDGEKEKERQYEPYKPFIENMLKQESYDFSKLIEVIQNSPDADITAALNKDIQHVSKLRDDLAKFRIDFTPGTITVDMHFNYQHLIQAFEIYRREHSNLLNGDNHNKSILFCRQVIGYVQRALTARERQLFAQGLCYVMINLEPLQQSFNFREGDGDFPITAGDDSNSGLGWDWFVGDDYWFLFKDYVEQKQQDLSNICNHASNQKRAGL